VRHYVTGTMSMSMSMSMSMCMHMHMHTCVHVCTCTCTRTFDTHCVRPQSKTDPRVAKTRADCTFVVEKKEQRKATVEHFVSRVFDIARPFQSFITSVRLQFNSLSELWPTHPPCTPSPPPSPHTIGVHPVIPKVCPSTRDLMILHALHGLRGSPSRTVLRIRRRQSAWQATCAHAAPKARCWQCILVSYPITHLQIRVSHFEQVSRFFLPSPTFISCSSCPTCSTCQLTCRFSAPRWSLETLPTSTVFK